MKIKTLRFTFAFLICSSLSNFAFSQSTQALKFDDFDDSVENQFYPFEEINLPRRIERFIKQTKQERGIKVYIIYYRARIIDSRDKYKISNWAAETTYEIRYKSKLKDVDVISIDGGYREKNTLEYWIAPKTVAPPKPTPSLDKSETFVCPNIYVSKDRTEFDEGKSLQFSVFIYDLKAKAEFQWKVSAGEIVEGQGTDKIKVKLSDLNVKRVTAFVEVSGLPFPCEKIGFSTAVVGNKPYLFDSAVRYNYSDLSARLDAFTIELNNNPAIKGYIIVYANRVRGTKEMERAVASVKRLFAFRKYELSRITIVKGGFREYDTVDSWLVPEGAESPIPTPTVDSKFIVPMNKIIKSKTIKRK